MHSEQCKFALFLCNWNYVVFPWIDLRNVEPEEIALCHGSHQFIAHGEQHQTNCTEDRHNQLIKIVEGCLSRILGTFKSQSFSKNTLNSPHPSRQKKRLTPVTFLGNLCHMAGLCCSCTVRWTLLPRGRNRSAVCSVKLNVPSFSFLWANHLVINRSTFVRRQTLCRNVCDCCRRKRYKQQTTDKLKSSITSTKFANFMAPALFPL